MKKIILIFFLFTLISSKKKFLGPEILSEELDDDISLQKSRFGGIPRSISIPKVVTPRPSIPRSDPGRVNQIPIKTKPFSPRIKCPHINLIRTIPSNIKNKI